jgi:hypothetical protein
MQLLTQPILEKFKRVGKQEIGQDTIIVCKFFHPALKETWYASEYDPKKECFFGYVDSDFGEWGAFTLAQLQSINIIGLAMERDVTFNPCKFSELGINKKHRGPGRPKKPDNPS